MTPREVKVVPHDPAWKEAFEAEAAVLHSVLADEALAIHHIGSTSVPGLSAKPVIDVLIEVREIEKVDAFDESMAAKGYEAWGENGIPGRRFFTKNRGRDRVFHIHVFEAGTLEAERHLAFRDYLREHPETSAAYARLKEELAEKHPTDIESYMDGKDSFIRDTEEAALYWTRSKRRELRC